MPKPVAVPVGGSGSCGTSVVAAMLDHLGIPMGRIQGNGHARPYKNWECTSFLKVCKEVWPWFELAPRVDYESTTHKVAEYLRSREVDGPMFGLKRPQAALLCVLSQGEWEGVVKPIWCVRPLDQVIESFAKYGEGGPRVERFISQLWGLCEGVRLTRPQDLCIPFQWIQEEPSYVVDRICDYLNLYAGEGEKARALGVVK